MPRATRKSSAARLDEPSTSQQAPDVADFNAMTLHAMKYMLSLTGRKELIKRTELVKHCLGGDHKKLPQILAKVKSLLAEVFKIQVHEVLDDKTVKGYICISQVAVIPRSLTKEEREHALLLSIVLTHIYMKSGSLMEGVLFKFVAKVGRKKIFADAQQTISETFVKQMYLRKEKVQLESGGFEERFQYQWGQRAIFEFPKKVVLENLGKIMQKDITHFVRQYEELESENEEEEAEGEEMDTTG